MPDYDEMERLEAIAEDRRVDEFLEERSIERAEQRGRRLVTRAAALARAAHYLQEDKAGMPYITHPARVAHGVARHGHKAMAVAWLHDVIEDTDVTAEDLRTIHGFPADVVDAVVLLTRTKDVPPADYYAAIRKNLLALAVKIADIADNSDPRRLHYLDEATQSRLRAKYADARRALGIA